MDTLYYFTKNYSFCAFSLDGSQDESSARHMIFELGSKLSEAPPPLLRIGNFPWEMFSKSHFSCMVTISDSVFISTFFSHLVGQSVGARVT